MHFCLKWNILFGEQSNSGFDCGLGVNWKRTFLNFICPLEFMITCGYWCAED